MFGIAYDMENAIIQLSGDPSKGDKEPRLHGYLVGPLKISKMAETYYVVVRTANYEYKIDQLCPVDGDGTLDESGKPKIAQIFSEHISGKTKSSSSSSRYAFALLTTSGTCRNWYFALGKESPPKDVEVAVATFNQQVAGCHLPSYKQKYDYDYDSNYEPDELMKTMKNVYVLDEACCIFRESTTMAWVCTFRVGSRFPVAALCPRYRHPVTVRDIVDIDVRVSDPFEDGSVALHVNMSYPELVIPEKAGEGAYYDLRLGGSNRRGLACRIEPIAKNVKFDFHFGTPTGTTGGIDAIPLSSSILNQFPSAPLSQIRFKYTL